MNVITSSLMLVFFVSAVNCIVEGKSAQHSGAWSDFPKTFNFGEYVTKFHKSYGQLEAVAKAKLFFARTLQIFKHNVLFAKNESSHYLNQNEYIDMTAEEAKRVLTASASELVPVEESLMLPDMPADDYYQLRRDDHHDGLSKASAGVANQKAPRATKVSSSVDFFAENSNETSIEPAELVRQLQSNKLLASEMSRLVEMRNSKKQLMEKKLKKIRESRKILSRVDPKTLNANYDSSLIPSRGWGRQSTDFTRSYANIMMDDFSGSFEPYPTPSVPVLPSSSQSQPATMSSLLNLVRDVYGLFTSGDEVEDVDDDKGDTEEELNAAKMAKDGQDPGPTMLKSPGEQSMSNGGSVHSAQLALLKQGAVKYDIDWRRTGCVPRAKAQRNCNACYVFSALDLMEFFYCQQMKALIEFSTQYVIDCGHKTQLNGCQGGKLSNVGIFIKKYGIQMGMLYPYAGVQQVCPFDAEADAADRSWQIKPTITRWRLHMDISAWYEWLPKTPIIVGINMPADFLAYGGGIHHGHNCVPDMVHAMVLVGSGIQDGKTFWLLKNTFSYSWGEGGYFRLSKRAPLKCFNSAIVVKAKF